ncbi:MAG: hypothetical protein CSA05_01815 [Bacteroidia bacterium]|nr:MAG: hypothetical protein CSA05_01815 [Bacteroidia bacterium]
MKRIIVSSVFIFALLLINSGIQAQCNQKVVYKCATDVQGAIYLRDFNAKLKKSKKTGPPPIAKFSVVLNKGTHYRFRLCDPIGFENRSVLYLYSSNKLLASTYNKAKNKDYKQFDFICRKTATYYVFISYKEGRKEKKGCAVGILSFVGKNKR